MKITVYRERGGGWRWRLNDGTRTEIAQCGEKYREQIGAERAADKFCSLMRIERNMIRRDGYNTIYEVTLCDRSSPTP